MAFYTGGGADVSGSSVSRLPNLRLLLHFQQQMAQQILTQFQEHPDSWTRVPDILERSSFPQSKVKTGYFTCLDQIKSSGFSS